PFLGRTRRSLTSRRVLAVGMSKEASRRVATFTESVIREMTRLCQAYGAINLAQGFPDFDPPVAMRIAAAEAIRQGYNQYSKTHGSILQKDQGDHYQHSSQSHWPSLLEE